MNNSLTAIPDVVFPCDNDLEIPTLDITMQAQLCEIPFLAFGEQKRTYDMGGNGTLHFYVDDYRFNSIYEKPEKILRHRPSSIVEPNFSTFNEMPISFGLQAIYKKRWGARMMQEKGLRVFVDLNVAQKYYALNMLGVPRGWGAYCTRGYSDRLSNLEFEFRLANEWAQGNKVVFVIYGGGIECRHFAQRNGCIYINPCVTTKKKIEASKQIHEGVAFLGNEFELNKLLPTNHFEMQLEDYTITNNLLNGETKKIANESKD
ncbi:MAG: DUF4417 domain-containing protein [Muribaculaceae bacterium]|nr:DUF4417 domain-containing protein [Muribaculaceae bacterium]